MGCVGISGLKKVMEYWGFGVLGERFVITEFFPHYSTAPSPQHLLLSEFQKIFLIVEPQINVEKNWDTDERG